MDVKLSEKQINIISNSIKKLLYKQDFDEVCEYRVLPPTFETNQFKILIIYDESKLFNFGSFREMSERTDSMVNDSWDLIYNHMDIPTQIFLWKKETC